LWGVGERTADALLRLGLRTVGDLANTPRATLQRALGPAVGGHLAELAWGRDPRRVVPVVQEKSIGSDETFPHDVDDPDYIHRELLRLAERTAARARAAGMQGRTVTVKVRFADFTTITRARTLPSVTDVGREIYTVARTLYDALGLERARIRLVGVRLEGLRPAGMVHRQLMLGERPHGWREAETAADRAARRFGAGSVRPAALVRRADDPRPAPTPRTRSSGWRGRPPHDLAAPSADTSDEGGGVAMT
jgi:DNA polymerase-4